MTVKFSFLPHRTRYGFFVSGERKNSTFRITNLLPTFVEQINSYYEGLSEQEKESWLSLLYGERNSFSLAINSASCILQEHALSIPNTKTWEKRKEKVLESINKIYDEIWDLLEEEKRVREAEVYVNYLQKIFPEIFRLGKGLPWYAFLPSPSITVSYNNIHIDSDWKNSFRLCVPFQTFSNNESKENYDSFLRLNREFNFAHGNTLIFLHVVNKKNLDSSLSITGIYVAQREDLYFCYKPRYYFTPIDKEYEFLKGLGFKLMLSPNFPEEI